MTSGPSPTAQVGAQIAGETPTPYPRMSPGPTASATTAPSQNEGQVWSRIRAALPNVPTPVPTWLPSSIDRSKVDLRMLVTDPADPRYEVVYFGVGEAQILIALGPYPRQVQSGWSGVGTEVRGVGAGLFFSGVLWNDRTAVAPRVVRWEEGPHVLRIESDRFTGDDLLHVAWYLDQSGKPAPAHAYVRRKVGSCAKQDGAPEDTVLGLLALTGRGDRDAVLDCFVMDTIGASGPSTVGNWAGLPTTNSVKLDSTEEISGRVQVTVTWSFAVDPGGAWGPTASRAFMLGPEDGRWRIYDLASMGYGHNP